MNGVSSSDPFLRNTRGILTLLYISVLTFFNEISLEK